MIRVWPSEIGKPSRITRVSSSSNTSRSAAKQQNGQVSVLFASLAITGSSRHSYHWVLQVITKEWPPLEVSDFTEEFAEQPPLERTIDVMAAVVEKDGHYLICRRPEHKRQGGLWEFPGGKVHEGERYEQATKRELAEELEVELSRRCATYCSRSWIALSDRIRAREYCRRTSAHGAYGNGLVFRRARP